MSSVGHILVIATQSMQFCVFFYSRKCTQSRRQRTWKQKKANIFFIKFYNLQTGQATTKYKSINLNQTERPLDETNERQTNEWRNKNQREKEKQQSKCDKRDDDNRRELLSDDVVIKGEVYA